MILVYPLCEKQTQCKVFAFKIKIQTNKKQKQLLIKHFVKPGVLSKAQKQFFTRREETKI